MSRGKPAKKRVRSSKSKSSAAPTIAEQVSPPVTVSEVIDSNTPPDQFSVSKRKPPRPFVLLVVGALLFAAGFQFGLQRNPSIIDDAINTLISNSPDEINKAVLERAAIEAVLKASGDSWANYFPKSALKVLDEANTNSYSGIGATLRKSRGGVIEVSGIAPQSPAAEAGLAVGDQVIEINSTDVQGASLSSAIALIRGALGDKVELKIVRDGQQKLVSLVARQISALNVEATQVSSKVGLVSINNFTAGTALQVETALRGLKVDDGLIIDLRGNPGGLVEEAVRVAQLFIGNGTIVSYRVSGNEKVYSAKNSRPIMSPIVVMINKSTASAAEILAAALQDRNRGVVIGERSYGKGSVQEFVTLGDGSKLEITVALYITPSGKTIEGSGVTPDLAVKPGELGTKALQILGGLASLSTSKGVK
mgnify:FL=1